MTFMKKILDALNLEKRNIPLPSIEDESGRANPTW